MQRDSAKLREDRKQSLANLEDFARRQTSVLSANFKALGVSKERFLEGVNVALRMNPDIIDCDHNTVKTAIMECCRDGLIPDGRQAAIIPFKGKASYMPMRDGLLMLIYRGIGGNVDIKSGYIKENDQIKVVEELGKDPIVKITRLVGLSSEESDVSDAIQGGKRNVVASYCWLKIPGKTAFLHVCDEESISVARSVSFADKSAKKFGKSSMWDKWPGQMAEKTAIKALMNKCRFMITDEMIGKAFESAAGETYDHQGEVPMITEQAVTAENVVELDVEKEKVTKPKRSAKKAKVEEKPKPVEVEQDDDSLFDDNDEEEFSI